MRLTSFTDYGMRILMRLSGSPGSSFTTEAIASEFALSRNHLAKVVQGLARAGFIETQRGAGGGFRLARPPAAITLGEVVRALEQGEALVECFRADGGACRLTPGCRLRARLGTAREAFLAVLDGSTLADCVYRPEPISEPGESV